jgi:flagellar basal body-associated protein FliL
MSEAPAPKKSSLLKSLLKVIGVLTAIIAVEMVAAAMLLPSAHDTELTARQLKAAQKGVVEDQSEGPASDSTRVVTLKQTREVDLGRYNVTRYNPESDTTLIVDFELFGVVLASDEGSFGTQFEANKVRLREQVIMTLAAADTTDLTDAELGLLKRRILEKTNRALGKPLVQEVLFSKFNFVER